MQVRGSVETEISKCLGNVKQSRKIIHQGCGWSLSHPGGPMLYEPPNTWESAKVFKKVMCLSLSLQKRSEKY